MWSPSRQLTGASDGESSRTPLRPGPRSLSNEPCCVAMSALRRAFFPGGERFPAGLLERSRTETAEEMYSRRRNRWLRTELKNPLPARSEKGACFIWCRISLMFNVLFGVDALPSIETPRPDDLGGSLLPP
jgi:hypothetical protein